MTALFQTPAPTHADLVLRAVRWLRGFHKCSLAFGELVAGPAYIPDAIGWRLRFSILVECKVSRSDFFADGKKLIHRNPDGYPGEERWYLTPPGLVKPEEVPAGWYLAEAHPHTVRMVTRPPSWPGYTHPQAADNPATWQRLHHAERAAAGIPFLLSAIRRHEAGHRFDSARGRFVSGEAQTDAEEGE